MAILSRVDSVKSLLHTVYADDVKYEDLNSEERRDMRIAVATIQRICNNHK